MTEKCEFPQSPRSRTYEGLDPLTREVQKLARPLLGQHGFTQVELITHWSDIMGSELAIGVKPVKLTFPAKDRMNGTLHVRTAGGAFAMTAYKTFKDPVAVEHIKADAGIDIGFTLIGMHLKKVAVPVRLEKNRIGEALVTGARTRPKFIGGERAVYDQTKF